jgi:hypothetical protein
MLSIGLDGRYLEEMGFALFRAHINSSRLVDKTASDGFMAGRRELFS